MKRDIWVRSFTIGRIPRYPCPTCLERTLKLSGSVSFKEPAFSKAYHKHDEFEPDWVTERVSLQLECDDSSCGEIVNVVGNMRVDHVYDDEEYGETIIQTIVPMAFYPAPPIIDFPEDMPGKAEMAARQAFHVCWGDTGSAANRIRASVELALDELGIPRTATSKKGKPVDLDLNGRIQVLEKQSGAMGEHASSFQALRVAGNAGSHSADDVSWDDLLDCFFLYEAALEDLFGSKSQLLAKAKANLLKLKPPKN